VYDLNTPQHQRHHHQHHHFVLPQSLINHIRATLNSSVNPHPHHPHLHCTLKPTIPPSTTTTNLPFHLPTQHASLDNLPPPFNLHNPLFQIRLCRRHNSNIHLDSTPRVLRKRALHPRRCEQLLHRRRRAALATRCEQELRTWARQRKAVCQDYD